MPTMSSYCKAIPITDLMRYEEWPSIVRDGYNAAGLSSTPYLFLHESYVVTESVFADEEVVVSNPSDEWRQFCRDVLNFRPEEFDTEAPSTAPESTPR